MVKSIPEITNPSLYVGKLCKAVFNLIILTCHICQVQVGCDDDDDDDDDDDCQVQRKHETAEGYFSEVGQEKVRRLYEIYRVDFEMFGYTAEGFLTPVVVLPGQIVRQEEPDEKL